MGVINSTVDQICKLTNSNNVKPHIHNLVSKLVREVATTMLNRYRGVIDHPIAVADPNLKNSDEARVMSQSRKILKRLIEFGPQTNYQLSTITLRVGARIADLRHQLRHTSWTIKSEHVQGATWVYSLIKKTEA